VSFVADAAGRDPDWIRIAYLTLAPLLGTTAASTLFAVALLASGQSSTITGTLAGQVVMEGFMNWRIRPWLRRMISRLLAIIPAIFIISIAANGSVTDLVNLSQVVLCLILPLAMFPLLHLTSSRKIMGRWRNGWVLLTLGWASVIAITVMDIYSLPEALKAPGRPSWESSGECELRIGDCGLGIGDCGLSDPTDPTDPTGLRNCGPRISRLSIRNSVKPRRPATWSSSSK